MKFNRRWAADYIRDRVVPDFQAFTDIVTKRLLPTFDSFGKEALVHGEEWFQTQAGHLDPMDDEQYNAAAYYADKAMDKTIAFADMLISMYFTSIGLFCVGLFHLFEQHMADLPLYLLDAHSYGEEVKLKEVTKLLKAEASIDVEAFLSWPLILELRLIANTVKHGEGKSAAKLRRSHPELFIHPSQRERKQDSLLSHSRVRKPLFGEDLYITPDDFSRYAEGIIVFWTELAEAMARG
jgi:hypothetical protein